VVSVELGEEIVDVKARRRDFGRAMGGAFDDKEVEHNRASAAAGEWA
jgi:hypothetical protein